MFENHILEAIGERATGRREKKTLRDRLAKLGVNPALLLANEISRLDLGSQETAGCTAERLRDQSSTVRMDKREKKTARSVERRFRGDWHRASFPLQVR